MQLLIQYLFTGLRNGNYMSLKFSKVAIYSSLNNKKVRSIISQTEEILKNLVYEHVKETGSKFSKNIIENYQEELINFIQVCPKEMLDKLDNPITFKGVKKVS